MVTGVTALEKYQLHIGGEWVDAASGETFETDNLFTAEPRALIPRGGPGDVDRAVDAAHAAFTDSDWSRMTPTRHGHLLRELGDLLSDNAEAPNPFILR